MAVPALRAKLAVALACTLMVATAGVGAVGGSEAGNPAPLCTDASTIGFAPRNYTPDATISDDGLHVAFRSDSQLVDPEPRQVRYHDVASGVTTEVTNAATGNSGGTTISGDGSRIVFVSTSDLVGTNPAARSEVFLYDVATTMTTQVTMSASGGSQRPSLSFDGSRIAFPSTADLVGSNPDGHSQLFLFDVAAETTTQLTQTTSGYYYSPSMAADGSRIAFASTADPLGTNPDGGDELFVVDLPGETITQLTADPSGASFDPSISADGSRIAFNSDADLTGQNPAGDYEIYLFEASDGSITGITPAAGADIGSYQPSLSADGTRLAYSSDGDYTGDNPAAVFQVFQVFLFDLTTGTTNQVSDTPVGGTAYSPSTSGDGTRTVFATSRDPATLGSPYSEIALASCGATTPAFVDVLTGHAFFAEIQWLAAARVTGGFGDGTYRPVSDVSRQAMAAFMYRLAGSPAFEVSVVPSFSDVGVGHPFFVEVEWLASSGVSLGYGDGTFRPTSEVSRQAMAAFMYRLLSGPGVAV
ncbi:MAG: PD40 domain-containing protein [Acidimicrobiia bacterium]|nr:PD40 domain-containing protein [Acidimicrobiia bacterium]